MYEHLAKPLLSKKKFYSRIALHFLGAITLVFISLMIGVVGYHLLENLSWIDSLLNASMILGGMGPVDKIHSDPGKIFASFYALFSGIIFLITVGVLFSPFYHRFLHKFHLGENS